MYYCVLRFKNCVRLKMNLKILMQVVLGLTTRGGSNFLWVELKHVTYG